MIATLIRRKQDLIGWIEGEKYDQRCLRNISPCGKCETAGGEVSKKGETTKR